MAHAEQKPAPLAKRAVRIPSLAENPRAKRYRTNMPGEVFAVPTDIAKKGVERGWWKYACTEDEQREAMAAKATSRRKAKVPSPSEIMAGVGAALLQLADSQERVAAAVEANTAAIQKLLEASAESAEKAKK